MNLAPTDLVSAHRWERVTFTTYALSLSFFEAVVLDALIRGNALRQIRSSTNAGMGIPPSRPPVTRSLDCTAKTSLSRSS